MPYKYEKSEVVPTEWVIKSADNVTLARAFSDAGAAMMVSALNAASENANRPYFIVVGTDLDILQFGNLETLVNEMKGFVDHQPDIELANYGPSCEIMIFNGQQLKIIKGPGDMQSLKIPGQELICLEPSECNTDAQETNMLHQHN